MTQQESIQFAFDASDALAVIEWVAARGGTAVYVRSTPVLGDRIHVVVGRHETIVRPGDWLAMSATRGDFYSYGFPQEDR